MNINPISILPFFFLLLSVAIFPLINKNVWEKIFPYISFGFGAIVVVYYSFLNQKEILVHTANEYVSFIILILSLFIITSGIHIEIKGISTPFKNVIFLFIGAIISNFIGTTGASILLIRPFIRFNKPRISAFHIVFFIFIVSNIGGSLTPIGDPPLFLGYLKGIPFFWIVENVFIEWIFTISILLLVFYVFDKISFQKFLHDSEKHDFEKHIAIKCTGTYNLFFLLIVLFSVFLQNPIFIRETLMLSSAAVSYFLTSKMIYEQNDFSFAPIKEVVIIFAGIFATMIPALQWLEFNSNKLELISAGNFFWGSGTLSSFLDNAPTYLSFFSTIIGLFVNDEIITQIKNLISTNGENLSNYSQPIQNTYNFILKNNFHITNENLKTAFLLANKSIYIKAISLGSVFFGAMTYIGNGPNFMINSIAQHKHIKTPHFLEYIYKFSLPILVPIFILVWIFFF